MQRLRTITVPGTNNRRLRGLATCPTNNFLYVADEENSEVHRLNLSSLPAAGSSITASTVSWSVARQPLGLSVNRAQNVLVATRLGKVQEYTPGGILVREISSQNSLYHAIEVNNGLIAVTHHSPAHGVGLMSVDGRLLHSYGGAPGSRSGQFHWPVYLAADKRGFILVTDQINNRIIVLDPTMSFHRILPLSVNVTGQIRGPISIWLDESQGRLYVGEGHYQSQSRLHVFDNVFNLRAAFYP
jgi:DNA-binding beta-propeller fold protein YncE